MASHFCGTMPVLLFYIVQKVGNALFDQNSCRWNKGNLGNMEVASADCSKIYRDSKKVKVGSFYNACYGNVWSDSVSQSSENVSEDEKSNLSFIVPDSCSSWDGSTDPLWECSNSDFEDKESVGCLLEDDLTKVSCGF